MDESGKKDVDRRELLRGAAAALTTLGASRLPAAAQTIGQIIQPLQSLFSPESLRADTLRSIRAILDGERGIERYPGHWNFVSFKYFGIGSGTLESRTLLEAAMQRRARIGIMRPSNSERTVSYAEKLVADFQAELHALAEEMKVGTYGVLIDVDSFKIHLLKKITGGSLQFVKFYDFSTPRKTGEREETDTSQIEFGLFWAREVQTGFFGEDVSHGELPADFISRSIDENGPMRRFTPSLSSRNAGPGQTTARILLANSQSPRVGGMNIHGTPQENMLGLPAEHAQLAVSNVGILDLLNRDAENIPLVEPSRFRLDPQGKWSVVNRKTPFLVASRGVRYQRQIVITDASARDKKKKQSDSPPEPPRPAPKKATKPPEVGTGDIPEWVTRLNKK